MNLGTHGHGIFLKHFRGSFLSIWATIHHEDDIKAATEDGKDNNQLASMAFLTVYTTTEGQIVDIKQDLARLSAM